MPLAIDFSFKAGSFDDQDLRVLRLSGSEGLSQCFVFDLELASTDGAVDFDELVGEKGHLTIQSPAGERHVDGIVSRWEEVGRGRSTGAGSTDVVYYTARLVPLAWTLSLMRRSRIFQKMSTPDILKKVFDDAQIPATQYRLSLNASYDPRLYCVQYRESDLDFVSRLMEEEGMFYFFEHTEDEHVMVVADKLSVHQELMGGGQVRFLQGEGGMAGEETVKQFRYARSLRPGTVLLKEFDFKKPTLALKATKAASSDKEKRFESYDYPGEYHVQGLGDRIAQVRLEEERSEALLAVGETDSRRFEPGFKFTLEQHPRDDFNREYVLTRVRHFGEQPHAGFAGGQSGGRDGEKVYRGVFECIPADVQFRAPRVTPRPRIDGPQTAVVVGPPGEEIHTDEHGRVKVKFHWDLSAATDDKASGWIRVSQAWGGSGWGAMIIPRVGQEVIVEFLEGDPDRPLITGRVYNGANPPPYDLPGAKTMTTIKSSSSPGGGGANEIRFEDAGGKEEFYIHGQKDLNLLVENNRTEHIKVDETVTIDGNRSVEVGGNQAEKVKGNDKTEVTGNQDVKVDGNQTIKVAGNRTDGVDGNRKTDVGGNDSLKVGGNGKMDFGGNLGVKVGGSMKVEAGSKIEEKGMQKKETFTATSKETVGASKKISAAGAIKLESASIKVAGLSTKIQGSAITVDGTKVEIKGAAMIKLEAGGSSIMLGPGILEIKTAGMVKINGAMIMLN